MIATKLNFSPHVIWAKDDGFYMFGHHDGRFVYCNMPNLKLHLVPSLSIGIQRVFNVVMDDKQNAMLEYCSNFYFRVPDLSMRFQLSQESGYEISRSIARKKYTERFKKGNIFEFKNNVFKPLNYRKPNNINEEAKYDYNDEHLVWCYGRTLLLDNDVIATQKRCKDVKISPDGTTLAFATGDEIHFMDLYTRTIKNSYIMNHQHVRHMCYSVDGLTIAAITQNQLIIWDVE